MLTREQLELLDQISGTEMSGLAALHTAGLLTKEEALQYLFERGE